MRLSAGQAVINGCDAPCSPPQASPHTPAPGLSGVFPQLSPCGIPVKQFQAGRGCQPWGWRFIQPLCMYTHQTHAGTHVHTGAHVLTHTHTRAHTHVCSCTLTTRAHGCTRAHAHSPHTGTWVHTSSRTHTHGHTCKRVLMHTHHTHMGTHMLIHIHHTEAHGHTHARAHSPHTLGLMHPLTHTHRHTPECMSSHRDTHVGNCSHGYAHTGVI